MIQTATIKVPTEIQALAHNRERGAEFPLFVGRQYGHGLATTMPNGAEAEYSYDGLQRLAQTHNNTSGNAIVLPYQYACNSRDVRTSVE